MSAVNQLGIYNEALRLLNEAPLSSLSEAIPSRYVLDRVWNSGNGFVHRVLESADLDVFQRSIKSVADTSFIVNHGYPYRHVKPDDWVRTAGLYVDDRKAAPLKIYDDKTDAIYCDYEVIYWDYISKDVSYGGDLTLWTQALFDYAAALMAKSACMAITGSRSLLDQMRYEATSARDRALMVDATNSERPIKRYGSWVRTRVSGYNSNGYYCH